MNWRIINLFLMIFLTIAWVPPLWAARALVIVLEAPFFREANVNSPVVQYGRKGDQVYIHNNHIGPAPYDRDYVEEPAQEAQQEEEAEKNLYNKTHSSDTTLYQTDDLIDERDINKENQQYDPDKFYKTMDKNGNYAYILKKHVKIIYNDSREESQPISPPGYDNMDYRLEEPLPPDYPINRRDQYRASISWGTGPSRKDSYDYKVDPSSEDYHVRQGFNFIYSKNIRFDKTRRHFWGGMFQYMAQQVDFTLKDRRESHESQSLYGLGPYFSYDPYRTTNNRLTFGGGFLTNWHRSIIAQQNERLSEERAFSGFSFAPTINVHWQFLKFLPWFDLIASGQFQYVLPYSLKCNQSPYFQELWNKGDDTIHF
ncbi:MAG: hypothetical protein WCG27_03965, partial [Pseudomonadota bacterium]